MKRSTVIAAPLLVAVGFLAGRATAPDPGAELRTIASFRQALDDPDWLSRTYRMTAFLRGLTPENLPAALEALEPHQPWLLTEELRLFTLAWTRFDPFGPIQHALSLEPPYNRNAIGAAAYALGFRFPTMGVRALDSVEDPELREFVEGRLVAGWTHSEFKQSADEYIASLPESPRRFGYVGLLAWELSKQGPAAVRQWAEGVPDERTRYKSAVFLKAAATLAAQEPAETARWLWSHAEAPYTDGALRVVVRSWASQDPRAVMEWLVALPAGRKRDGGVTNAFGVWLDRDPAAAEAWLRAATPARALDPAVRIMVGRTRDEAPEAARAWALATETPVRRERLLAYLEGRAAEPEDGPDEAMEPAEEAPSGE